MITCINDLYILDGLEGYKVDFLRYKLHGFHIIQQYEDELNSILFYYQPESLCDIGKDKIVLHLNSSQVLKIHDFYPIELTIDIQLDEILYPDSIVQFGSLYATIYPKAEWVGDVDYDDEWNSIQSVIPNISDPHLYKWLGNV